MELYITHAWAPEDFLLKGWSKLAGDALRRDFNNPARACTNACAGKCALRVFSLCPVPRFQPKSSRGSDAIWHLVSTAFALCVVPLEPGAEE